MPGSEETGPGPVIHDHRRIDPVTGQVRGKHAASKPAGTTGAGRPAAGSSGNAAGGPAGGTAGGADDAKGPVAEDAEGPDAKGPDAKSPDAKGRAMKDEDELKVNETEVLEGVVEDERAEPAKAGRKQSDAEARLAERTADLQRLQAEYANYRKRVDRDRAAVREQAVAATLAGLLPVLDAIDQAREHGELSGGFKSVADSLSSALGKLGLVAYGDSGDPFDPTIHEALTSSYSPDVAEDTCVEILQPGYKVGDRILRPARVAVAAPATGPDGISNDSDDWPSDEEGN
jgi:molecular chaperone GrpE